MEERRGPGAPLPAGQVTATTGLEPPEKELPSCCGNHVSVITLCSLLEQSSKGQDTCVLRTHKPSASNALRSHASHRCTRSANTVPSLPEPLKRLGSVWRQLLAQLLWRVWFSALTTRAYEQMFLGVLDAVCSGNQSIAPSVIRQMWYRVHCSCARVQRTSLARLSLFVSFFFCFHTSSYLTHV